MVSERKKVQPEIKTVAVPVVNKLVTVDVAQDGQLVAAHVSNDDGSPKPEDSDPLRYVVVHTLPGRVRIEIESLRQKHKRADHLCNAIIEEPGV